jgi:hypothetical protein
MEDRKLKTPKRASEVDIKQLIEDLFSSEKIVRNNRIGSLFRKTDPKLLDPALLKIQSTANRLVAGIQHVLDGMSQPEQVKEFSNPKSGDSKSFSQLLKIVNYLIKSHLVLEVNSSDYGRVLQQLLSLKTVQSVCSTLQTQITEVFIVCVNLFILA